MADEIDKAQETSDFFLGLALRQSQHQKQIAPAAGTGWCLHCGVVVEENRRWCGPECRDDWEKARRDS